MNHLRSVRAMALSVALAMTLLACGQKPGVHVDGATGGTAPLGAGAVEGDATAPVGDPGTTTGAVDGSGTGTTTDAGGTTTDGAAAGGTTGGGTTTGDTGGGTAGGGSTGSAGGSGSGGSGSGGSSSGGSSSGGDTGPRQVTGSDRTGVTDDAITLAVHAPVTGAAPLPSTSFEKARDMYWRWVTEGQGQKVLGRSSVEVLFKDDKYDPNSARQACRELAAKAFLSIGGGGTDQIQACGQFAQVAKTPYFSAGVTEKGLEGNPWYFASSMTYKQQGLLLAQYVKKNLAGQKVAAIVTDTPNFDDAIAGWEAGLQQTGLQSDYYKTLRHPKGDTSWYSSFAQELAGAGVKVVYILSSPVDYIRFAQKASEQGFKPQYVGVGITKGLNAVLGSGCPQVDGGIFFSPFPGLDVVNKLAPDFNKAAAKFGMPNDDLALALWGIAEQQHELFKRYESTYGTDLTREDFRALAEVSKVETNVFPAVSYSAQSHFGGNAVHVLKADCGTKQHKTLATFASSF